MRGLCADLRGAGCDGGPAGVVPARGGGRARDRGGAAGAWWRGDGDGGGGGVEGGGGIPAGGPGLPAGAGRVHAGRQPGRRGGRDLGYPGGPGCVRGAGGGGG